MQCIKSISFSHRLWISNLNSLIRCGSDIFIQKTKVQTIQLQGIVVSIKKWESVLILTIDDSTGLIDCVFYYIDFERLEIIPGDLIRVCGNVGTHQGEISIKLRTPPYKIANFDEEIEWALSVDKLWKDVYTVEDSEEDDDALEIHKNNKERNSKIYDIVKSIRELKTIFIDYSTLKEICQFNTENIVLELLHDGFLVQKNNSNDLNECEFYVSSEPYHPKEVIRKILEGSEGPISYEQIIYANEGRFKNSHACVVKSISELMDENIIYEVRDSLYQIIRISQ